MDRTIPESTTRCADIEAAAPRAHVRDRSPEDLRRVLRTALAIAQTRHVTPASAWEADSPLNEFDSQQECAKASSEAEARTRAADDHEASAAGRDGRGTPGRN